MDSGNSGSLQSSSGGDDEYDSRGAGAADSSSLSALFRPSPTSSAAFALHSSFYNLQELTPSVAVAPPQGNHWSSSFPAAAASSSRVIPTAAAATSAPLTDQPTQAPAPPAPPRGSRKRSRASRRAPTTVLTTDTTNFRAMVQEFTGIPSPPFAPPAAASASLRTRFDHFFPSASSLRSAAAAAAAADPNSLPPYLLRPFAQKIQPSPFPPFTSSSSASPSSCNIGIANANASAGANANTAPFAGDTATVTAATTVTTNPTTASGDNYQLPPSALLTMQEPNYLSFQNLLSSQLGGGGAAKYPMQGMFGAGFASTARLQEQAEFLAGSQIGFQHGLMGSEGLHLHPRGHGHGSDELSGLVGGASGSSSCKLNYSAGAGTAAAAAEQLNVEKASDTGATAAAAAAAATRGEGVDSWICTSE